MKQKKIFLVFMCFFAAKCFSQDFGSLFFQNKTNENKVAYEHYVENLLHTTYEQENEFLYAYSEYIFYKQFAQKITIALKNFDKDFVLFYKQAEKFSKQKLELVERFFSWLTKDALVQHYLSPLVLELDEPLVETSLIDNSYENKIAWHKFIALTQAETLYERLNSRFDNSIPLEHQLAEKSVTLSDSAFAALINNPGLLAVVFANQKYKPLVLLLKNTINEIFVQTDSVFLSSDFFTTKGFLFPKDFYEACYRLLPDKFIQEDAALFYQTDALFWRVTYLSVQEGIDISQILPASLAMFYEQIIGEPFSLITATTEGMENLSKNLEISVYLFENYATRVNELLKFQSILNKH